MTSIVTHADEESLERYSMGKLSADEAGPLEEHLLVCEMCQTRLDESEMFVRAMRGAMLKAKKEPGAAWGSSFWERLDRLVPARRPAWITAFAAVAILVAVATQLPRLVDKKPVAVYLLAMRGTAETTAVAGRPIDLTLEARDLAPAAMYRMEIVTISGRKVWESMASAHDAVIHAQVLKPLDEGQYFVRIYGGQSKLLTEYSLRVR